MVAVPMLLDIFVPDAGSNPSIMGPLSSLLALIFLAGGISFVAGIVGGLAEHAERRNQ
jgi:hypothetical protein